MNAKEEAAKEAEVLKNTVAKEPDILGIARYLGKDICNKIKKAL